jgi:hypothetical protein
MILFMMFSFRKSKLNSHTRGELVSRSSQFTIFTSPKAKSITLAFSCGARSAFGAEAKRLLEKHAIAPSAARLC